MAKKVSKKAPVKKTALENMPESFLINGKKIPAKNLPTYVKINLINK